MEKFNISVARDKEIFHFEVVDYPHHEGERCKFEVYHQGNLVAGFEPDKHEYLKICKDTGNLDKEVLYLLADQMEAYNL